MLNTGIASTAGPGSTEDGKNSSSILAVWREFTCAYEAPSAKDRDGAVKGDVIKGERWTEVAADGELMGSESSHTAATGMFHAASSFTRMPRSWPGSPGGGKNAAEASVGGGTEIPRKGGSPGGAANVLVRKDVDVNSTRGATKPDEGS